MKSALFLFTFFFCYSLALGQLVGTFAGFRDSIGAQDGTTEVATFHNPHGIAISPQGNIFLCDRFNHTIRKITPDGVVSTIAGSPGLQGDVDGQGANARFYEPWGLCVDSLENIFVADTRNNKIRKVSTNGTVTTYAGTGNYGITDGPYHASTFGQPVSLALDDLGNIYVADHSTHIIRKIDPDRNVSTLAGSPFVAGDQDGSGTLAQFNRPYGLAIDLEGNLLVADEWNHKIKQITPDGLVSTIAGTGSIGSTDSTAHTSTFHYPWDVCVDDQGRIYVADGLNYTIRRLSPGDTPEVTTYAGQTGVLGSLDGSVSDARFVSTTGITFSPLTKELYVADAYNNLIRRITDPTKGLFLASENPATIICPEDLFQLKAYPNLFETYRFFLNDTLIKTTNENSLDTSYFTSGNYNFRVEGDIADLTALSDNFSLDVFPVSAVTIDTIGETTFFEGDSVTLIASFGMAYFWSNGEASPAIKVQESGTYSVEVTDGNGCVGQSTAVEVTMIADLDPILILYEGAPNICPGEEAWLTTNYTTNVQWIKDGWAIPGADQPMFLITESGTYQVRYTSPDGFTILSDPISITIYDVPELDFRVDPPITNPGKEISYFDLSEPGGQKKWYFGDGSSASTNDTLPVLHLYEEIGDYTLSLAVSTAEGCVDSLVRVAYISIVDDPIDTDNRDDVFIPSAFTPNGDGSNDILYVRGTDIGRLHFKVMNQWGQLLFETQSQDQGWDGTYKGADVPIGNYHYLLEYTNLVGRDRVERGLFTILK